LKKLLAGHLSPLPVDLIHLPTHLAQCEFRQLPESAFDAGGMGAEWVSSGVRPNKKSHPHGWLDWFLSRFAGLAYAASHRFREA
jgi:hypothetical protein